MSVNAYEYSPETASPPRPCANYGCEGRAVIVEFVRGVQPTKSRKPWMAWYGLCEKHARTLGTKQHTPASLNEGKDGGR